MIRYEQMKTTLNSFALDKMVVLLNHSCASYLPGLILNKNYIVKCSN
jgi:hypothetical protein